MFSENLKILRWTNAAIRRQKRKKTGDPAAIQHGGGLDQ
jgi:hypothetical protein